MKKFISLFLILSLIFCFAACGGNETPDENINNNSVVDNADDNSGNIITSNNEITVDDVKNAPVSPESDFEVYEPDSGVVIIDSYIGNEEIVVIPETINGKKVTEIGDSAFVNADTVRAVKFADTIECVGSHAFKLNESIEIIVCGANVKKIEDYAFSSCPNLRSIELNDGLEYIGDCVMISNPCLKEFYIPGSVKEIGSFLPEEDAVVICDSGSVAESYCKDFAYNYKVK